jgi:hypothetical protein
VSASAPAGEDGWRWVEVGENSVRQMRPARRAEM